MGVWIEQRFWLGRFHATRWRQNPFEDRYGEWPPSPWRFLRALAARWFQYSRETGDADVEKRRRVLNALSGSVPSFYLPAQAYRGPALRQYQPIDIGWSDPAAKAAAVKAANKTLVADAYWCVPSDDSVIWWWHDVHLAEDERELLVELLCRLLYFGRAETRCQFRALSCPPAEQESNCHLVPNDPGGGVPVLVVEPSHQLNEAALLSATDDPALRRASVPPGTAWYFAMLPPKPADTLMLSHPNIIFDSKVQFAVGGRVYPPPGEWVKLVERMRGTAVRSLCERTASKKRYEDLTPSERERIRAFVGKDRDGMPLTDHSHPYFCVWPDEAGEPTRVIVWRSTPFNSDEMQALWASAASEIAWRPLVEGHWSVRMVPLPAQTQVPPGFLGPATEWRSVTPFVPPAERRRFRKSGKERPGETVQRNLERLLLKLGFPSPLEVTVQDQPAWIKLHQTKERRKQVVETGTPFVRPGYLVKIRFSAPIKGPILVGDSSHFGLGLFRAV